ncbi:hypothetical protein QUB75_19705 [Microcoleus sp. K1-B6]|uniref:hypothetical protein n=1 Tax=Microcoleus sp. K1-B6 TaxID=2818787 RepID=UPI002FD80DEC
MGKISNGITQATASTEGTISIEGDIRGRKAQGSIDSEGIWDLGIDFKVGGLGVTNDYGGAITVSIAGQSITWGREGGKIHYQLGGFEVIVEARDCVVTETKKIMGIEVASHTYPDPGCEIPDPKIELPDVPQLPGEDGIDIDTMTGLNLAYALLTTSSISVSTTYRTNSGALFESRVYKEHSVMRAENIPEIVLPRQPYFPDFNLYVENVQDDTLYRENYSIQSGTYKLTRAGTREPGSLNIYNNFYNQYQPEGINTVLLSGSTVTLLEPTGNNVVGSRYPATAYLAYGPINAIAAFVRRTRSEYSQEERANTYSGANSTYTYSASLVKRITVSSIVPVGEQKKPKPQPFLQPGVPPHMNDCCEEIVDMLEDLKDVLHVDFFKKKKFPIPTYLLAPGCEPGNTTNAENYYHLFQKIFQAIAHNTIVSPQIDIQDADAVKEGDQKINERYLSATGWAEAVTKMLYEIVDDGNIGTNMDIRTGVTVTQLLVAVADLSYKVDCIIDCIGVTTKRTKGEVETSYNLVVEGENTKGFDPKKSNQQLDLNSDISTEKLLAGLLRTRKNPIVKEEIHPKSPTLFEMINDLKNK